MTLRAHALTHRIPNSHHGRRLICEVEAILTANIWNAIVFQVHLIVPVVKQLERDAARTMEVVRFVVRSEGGRMVKAGSPVLDKAGKTIGVVTSAAKVGKRQIGLALVEKRTRAPRTAIAVYALPRPEKVPAGKSVLDLEVGDRVAMHEDAEILRRFYKPGETL